MKKKLLTVSLVLMMLAIMFVPVYATTFNWSFTMTQSYVNGYSHGSIYLLNAGNMSLNGKVWTYSTTSKSTPLIVYADVFQLKTLVDRKVGTTSVVLSKTLNKKATIYGAWGYQPKGKYYLIFYTAKDDGWNKKGSGQLITTK